MCPANDDPHAPLDAFLEAFWQDVENDAIRPLADYLAAFPGDDTAIAGQYRAFKDAGAQAMGGATASESSANRVAHYRKIRQIGRGGQGTVYLAEDTHLHRQVALKIMDPGFASDVIAVERFKREAEITSKLDHPGICTVYETGEDRGSRWIAMRYVEGEPLVRKITAAKEGQASGSASTFVVLTEPGTSDKAPTASLPPPDTTGPKTWTDISRLVFLFEDAARALHAAHEVGVIHRDIKPGNMMVTTDRKPVILDFGLAVDTESNLPTLTMTGDLMGTKEYMSPEQIAAHRITLDRRTDVYSLGVSLFECLALRRPFEAPTREGLYEAIMTKAPPDLRRLNPAVPADLRVVVATAIEKERDRRYQTALDLAEELRRVRMHEPIVARPVGPLVRLQRWAQRSPGLATALAGLIIVFVITIVIAAQLFMTERLARDLSFHWAAEAHLKEVALADYERLGDYSRLARLTTEADLLWPAEPSKVAAMRAWVDQGTELAQRLADHRDVLGRLRSPPEAGLLPASAAILPYSSEDRAADLAAHASDQQQLAELRKRRDEAAAALAASESRGSLPAESLGAASRTASRPSADQIRGALAKLDANIPRMDAKIHERLTWKFGSTSVQFKHDTTSKLVGYLTAFVDPDPHKGLLADVRARLAFAESVARETIDKYETKWADASRSIANKVECPKYGGLKIIPQLGLIPIGKDSASGLWEFAHLQTTAYGTDPMPKRDNDGHLVVTEGTGIVFVLLPGGTFRMGAMKEPPDEDTPMSAPNVDPQALEGEGRVTEVPLDPFFLSKYEMTQGQWLRLVGKNPSQYGPGWNFGGVRDLRHPVEQISWEDCDVWLGRLGLILPTEAQWEYGARGGTTTSRWTGIGTEGLANAANLADEFCKQNGGVNLPKHESWNDGYGVHAPAGSFAANPFGLHDVLGNVWEWCRDWHGSYELKPRAGDGLRSPSASRIRVLRGGSFMDGASFARSAHRNYYTPAIRSYQVGVRPARSVDP